MLPAGLFRLFWFFWFGNHLGRAAYHKYADPDQHICLVYTVMVAYGVAYIFPISEYYKEPSPNANDEQPHGTNAP